MTTKIITDKSRIYSKKYHQHGAYDVRTELRYNQRWYDINFVQLLYLIHIKDLLKPPHQYTK